MSVTWFLLSKEWNKEEGKLPKDAKVTVDGKMAGEEVNLNSFWGQVVKVCSNGTYEVKDESGKIHVCERKRLRHRVKHSICFGHISDDKSHDRFAMQHYSTREMEWIER